MRLVLGLLVACLLFPAAAGAGERDILALGQRLVTELPSPTPANAYGAPAAVTWAGLDGGTQTTHQARCASLVTQLLRASRGYSSQELQGWFGSASPTAAQYRAAIAGAPSPALTRLGRVTELQPGDVVAIEYADEPDGEDTGHMVVVAGAPQPATGGPVLDGAAQYSVDVIDATTSPHGLGDTRRYLQDGTWKSQPGVGRGRMRLYASPTGSPAGYAWSLDKGSELRVVADRPMELARPAPPTAPQPDEPPLGGPTVAGDPPVSPGGPPPLGAGDDPGAQEAPASTPGSGVQPPSAGATLLRGPRGAVVLRAAFASRRVSARALRRRRALGLRIRSTEARSVVATVLAVRGRRTFVLARRRVALPPNRTVSVAMKLARRPALRLRRGTVLLARVASPGLKTRPVRRRLAR